MADLGRINHEREKESCHLCPIFIGQPKGGIDRGAAEGMPGFHQGQGPCPCRNLIDRALSARTDDRPDFQRMIADSSKKGFDVVLVWKLDRFSRNRLDSLQYRAILKKNGVDLVSATENISDGPEGVLLDSLLTGLAEYYSKDLSQKVKRGLTENVINGKANGGLPTLGYKVENGRYLLEETDSKLVKILFDLYSQGSMTSNKIVEYLKDKGLKNSKGKYLTHATIARTLTNRRYIGEYRIGEHLNTTAIPPIVSKELFDKVQEQVMKNRRWTGKHKAKVPYFLTGKLFCGECGETLISDGGTSKTGRDYHYYLCKGSRGKNRRCGTKRYPKDGLESIVVQAVNAFMSDEKLIRRLSKVLYKRQDAKSNELSTLESNETKLKNKIDNLMTALEDGDVAVGMIRDRLANLKAELDKTQEEIIRLKSKNPRVTLEQIEYLLRAEGTFYKDATPEEKRRIINHFVNSVFVYKNNTMIVFFNFLNEKAKVTFNDLCSNVISVSPPLRF